MYDKNNDNPRPKKKLNGGELTINNNMLSLVVVYQSFCVGSVTNFNDTLANHSKQKNQSYIRSTVKFESAPNGTPLSYLDSDTGQVSEETLKWEFLRIYMTNLLKHCVAVPDIVVIGEFQYSAKAQNEQSGSNECNLVKIILGSKEYIYWVRDSVLGGENGSEQRHFTMLVSEELKVCMNYDFALSKIESQDKNIVDGAVYFRYDDIYYIFVHIPNVDAKGAGLTKWVKGSFSNVSGYCVLFGDTNQGVSKVCARAIDNFYKGIAKEDDKDESGYDSTNSQGERTENDYTETLMNTGGGGKAYHDTIITNANLLLTSKKDENSNSAMELKLTSCKRNLAGRPTCISLTYMPRVVDGSYVFTDHRGVSAIVCRPVGNQDGQYTGLNVNLTLSGGLGDVTIQDDLIVNKWSDPMTRID